MVISHGTREKDNKTFVYISYPLNRDPKISYLQGVATKYIKKAFPNCKKINIYGFVECTKWSNKYMSIFEYSID